MNNHEHPLITEFNSLIQNCHDEIQAICKEFNFTPQTLATCSNVEIIKANRYMPKRIKEAVSKCQERGKEIILQLPPTENTEVCLMLLQINIDSAKALIDILTEQVEFRGLQAHQILLDADQTSSGLKH